MLMSSTDRHPFSDCLTHRVCREAETNLSKSKIALKRFSNGIRAWDRSAEVFIENVGSWLTMKDRLLRVQDLNSRKGQSSRWRGTQEWRGSEFKVRPGVSLADVCVGLRGSGESDGCLGVRECLGSSGTHMSLAHGSCGSWRTTGGSRCYTCYTRSWLGLQKASCRNTSPGPTSRRLRR